MIALNKKEIITTFFLLLCLAGYVFFPATGYFQYKAVIIIFMVLLPFLYNKYFLKEIDFFRRINIGDWKKGLKWLAIGMGISFLIIGFAFWYGELLEHYFIPAKIRTDFWKFLIYEFTGVAFTVAVYEIFFRGFVMFHFTGLFKKWSILVQFLFFVLMILFFSNLPYWFYITYLIFTPFAGLIAYKSNSILYSFIGQLFFIIIVDATCIALTVK